MSLEGASMAGLRDRLEGALNDAVHSSEDEMVVKWACQIETVDSEGKRGLWTLASKGATPWDKLGLLSFGLERQRADMTAERINDGS